MRRTVRRTIKVAFPLSLINRTLLMLPFLDRTRLVNYESNVYVDSLGDLLSLLDSSLPLEGEIIECGSARCGTSVIMARYLRSRGVAKKIFACDSFEGFDPAELHTERELGLTSVPETTFTSATLEYVRKKLDRLGLSDIVVPVKGFFQDTLPDLDVGFYSFAFIDCDLKDSMMFCAETVWPKLVSDGYIAFDDYLAVPYPGARIAIDRFVSEHEDSISEHGLRGRFYFVRKA